MLRRMRGVLKDGLNPVGIAAYRERL